MAALHSDDIGWVLVPQDTLCLMQTFPDFGSGSNQQLYLYRHAGTTAAMVGVEVVMSPTSAESCGNAQLSDEEFTRLGKRCGGCKKTRMEMTP